jgi:copper chaperone CopZ
MKTFQTDLPAMYGDHHVIEVRRLLSQLPGVADIYASSAFQLLQVEYDETKTKEEEILAKLEEAGYLGELIIPQETNLPANENGDKKAFRHTAAFEQTKQVSFHRETSFTGRPLWPCPGIGTLKKVEK